MTESTTTPTAGPWPVTFQDAETVLAAALPGYESRPHQSRLAAAIESEFFVGAFAATVPGVIQGREGEPIQVDVPRSMFGHAPTGSGKSLAYLIPAILAPGRVVVSVTTKALQEQLAGSDLPFLQTHLGVPFTWALLKGRSNYLCTNRAEAALEEQGPSPAVSAVLAYVREHPETRGLREELPEVSDVEWWSICGDEEDCEALDCKEIGGCYLYAARRLAAEADVVIVNHALYCTDLQMRIATNGNANMLGDFTWTILDEAHEFHEVALSSLSTRLTAATFTSLANNVRNWLGRYADNPSDAERLSWPLVQLATQAASLFAALPASRTGEALRIRAQHLDGFFEPTAALMDTLTSLGDGLASVKITGTLVGQPRDTAAKRLKSLRRRVDNAGRALNDLLTADLSELVRWTETERTKRGNRLAVKMSPVDISGYLRDNLFARRPVLMVSATLAVKGKFDFQAEQLGVDNYTGIIVGTSFDHTANTRLYVPLRILAPNQDGWESQALEEMRRLVEAAEGRTLILFTSVAHMKRAHSVLEEVLPYPVKVQGAEPTSALKDWFLANPEAVLLATKSFMTGFDARGETLSQVIITKMPFPVPTDPMFEARSELVKRRGGNDFSDLAMPVMSIVLQQAVGRLMRHSTDMGVVAILDHRIASKGYGKQIMKDLPPMTLTHDRSEAEAFLALTREHFAGAGA